MGDRLGLCTEVSEPTTWAAGTLRVLGAAWYARPAGGEYGERDLEDAGLVIANPLKASRRKGEWVECRVNDAAVTEVWLRLGQPIGEI